MRRVALKRGKDRHAEYDTCGRRYALECVVGDPAHAARARRVSIVAWLSSLALCLPLGGGYVLWSPGTQRLPALVPTGVVSGGAGPSPSRCSTSSSSPPTALTSADAARAVRDAAVSRVVKRQYRQLGSVSASVTGAPCLRLAQAPGVRAVTLNSRSTSTVEATRRSGPAATGTSTGSGARRSPRSSAATIAIVDSGDRRDARRLRRPRSRPGQPRRRRAELAGRRTRPRDVRRGSPRARGRLRRRGARTRSWSRSTSSTTTGGAHERRHRRGRLDPAEQGPVQHSRRQLLAAEASRDVIPFRPARPGRRAALVQPASSSSPPPATTRSNGTPSGVRFAPANDPFVITVGAVDIERRRHPDNDFNAPWSAYGYTVDGFAKPDLGAPGRYVDRRGPGRHDARDRASETPSSTRHWSSRGRRSPHRSCPGLRQT